MKYISIKICLVIVALFGGVAVASDLPDCPSKLGFQFPNPPNPCFGTETWADGSKYVGALKDGKRYGQGTYTWSNGNKYVGEWKDGKRYGQGTQVLWGSGAIKKGMWKDNEFFGTIAEFEKRIAKEKQDELVRQEKKDKYDRIFNACLLDKSSSVDMQVNSIESAVKETCKSIAKKPSWLESLRYE